MIDQERTQSLFRKLDRLLSHTRAAATPERVHQVRTTARRLEAVLEICYPAPTKRVARMLRQLKKVRKRAGAVRDVDVQSAALRGLKIGREGERKSRLLACLADERGQRESKFQKIVHSRKNAKLRKRLQQTAREMADASAPPELNGHSQPPVWIDFDPVASSLRMFAGLTRQMKSLTAENLHSYRTRGKRIRYVAEMAGNTPDAKRIVRAFKRTQDVIGDWHDWLTLTETAEELFHRSLDSALVSALRNIANAKFVEARTVVQDAQRELMHEYRAMLERERAKKRSPAAGRQSPARELRVDGRTANRAERSAATAPRRKPPSPAPDQKTAAGVA